MDPAALGTTRIGLDGIRREQEHDERGDAHMTRGRPRRRPVRLLVAAALRWTAALLEPAPTNGYGASASDG